MARPFELAWESLVLHEDLTEQIGMFRRFLPAECVKSSRIFHPDPILWSLRSSNLVLFSQHLRSEDIMETAKNARKLKLGSVIGLLAEMFVCKHLCQGTGVSCSIVDLRLGKKKDPVWSDLARSRPKPAYNS